MKEITDVDEIIEELVTGRWFPRSANPATSSNYPGLSYKCGCGAEHPLISSDFIMVGTPVKFVFICEKNYMTGVRVKGMFRQNCIELWTCTHDLYLKAAEKVNEG